MFAVLALVVLLVCMPSTLNIGVRYALPLYPMLARLEERGLVTSRWEPEPATAGRPPRRYYQLTGEGVRVARRAARPSRAAAAQPAARPGLAGSS